PPGADVDRHDRVDVVDGPGPQGPAHDRLRMCDEPPTCTVSGSMRVLRLCQRARWTLPALRQLVQTLSFFLVPPTIARTVWMLGFQRRFVRRWECEMLWPKLGDLAHTSHVEATGVSSVVRRRGRGGIWLEVGSPGSSKKCNRIGQPQQSTRRTDPLGHPDACAPVICATSTLRPDPFAGRRARPPGPPGRRCGVTRIASQPWHG